MAFDDLLKQLEKDLSAQLGSQNDQLSHLMGKDISDLTPQQKQALFKQQIQHKEEELKELERKKQSAPSPQKESFLKTLWLSLTTFDGGGTGKTFQDHLDEGRQKELRRELQILKEALAILGAGGDAASPAPKDTRSREQQILDSIRAMRQEEAEELVKCTTDEQRAQVRRLYRQKIDKLMESL